MSSWVGPAIQAGGSVLGGIAGGKGSKSSKPPKWLRTDVKEMGQFGQNLAQTPYTPYTGDRVAPFSQDTLNAFDLIRNNVGTTQPYYSSALDTASRLQNASISPQMVGTSFNGQNVQTQFDPRNIGTNFTAQNVQTAFDPRLATAAQFAGTDLNPYLNPYTNEVVNASLGDLENQRAVQYNNLASQAQAAGAFGGSRFGVAQGQFEADALRDKGVLASQLRNQGFNTAANLAMQDIASRNQFGLANQAAGQFADQLGMQGQLANQGANLDTQRMGLQANLANQAAGITADQMGFQGQLANQQAGQFAQQLGMQGQLANQQANLQGQISTAEIQNRNAFLSGVLAQNMGAQNTADAQALAGAGAAQQALAQQGMDVGYSNYMDQRNWPSQQLNWWNSALSPGVAVGTSMAGAPASTGGGLLGALGGAQLGAQAGGSIWDWWKGMGAPASPYSNGGSYDSYSTWDY